MLCCSIGLYPICTIKDIRLNYVGYDCENCSYFGNNAYDHQILRYE